jgi:excisionase family DNA binding protein
MPENGISVAEAARKLGLGLGYVYSLVQGGRLPAQKVDGKWCISAEAVQSRLDKKAGAQ